MKDKLLELLKISIFNTHTIATKIPPYGESEVITFDDPKLNAFLDISLSEFNQTPHFTNFSFKDDCVDIFSDVLIEGATIRVLLYQSSLNANMYNTNVLESLKHQLNLITDIHFRKLNNIKQSLAWPDNVLSELKKENKNGL